MKKAIVKAKINPNDKNKLDIWVEIQQYLDDMASIEKFDLGDPNVLMRPFKQPEDK